MDAVSAPEQTQEQVEQPARKNKGKIGWIIAFVVMFSLLAVLWLGLGRASQGPIKVGDKVPNFGLTTFDGQQINLADHSGKVIVLNFWASWCKPCEQEAADMEAAWRYYQDRGDVIFLGVDYTDTEPEALAYLDKFDITYPNGPDLGTRISQGFRIRGVPETYFIDPNGKLADFQIGPFSNLGQIQAKIDSLLGD